MHISIRRYKTKSPADITREVQEEFLPLISKSPGFVAYYGIEAGRNVWASVSIFDTQSQAEDSNLLAADWARKTVGPMVEDLDITAGNVVVHKAK